MLKNGGVYGDRRYLRAETIDYFTRRHRNDSRRALGWDKMETRPNYILPTTQHASPHAYGHLGYTGTCVWVDPEHDLIFVMLANRTYKAGKNSLYNNDAVRARAHSVVYRAAQAFAAPPSMLP
jgi:CubicO group peptidase (beta-lactamase class C family)